MGGAKRKDGGDPTRLAAKLRRKRSSEGNQKLELPVEGAQSLIEVIRAAEELPAESKAMLMRMTTASVETAAPSPPDLHARVFTLLTSAFERLQADVRSASAACVDSEITKISLDTVAREATERLAAAFGVVQAKKLELDGLRDRVKSNMSRLAEAKVAQRRSEAARDQGRTRLVGLEAALGTHLKTLRETDPEARVAEAHRSALIEQVRALDTDPSFLKSLQVAFSRSLAERSVFDRALLQELENLLARRLESVRVALGVEETAASSHEVAVSAAQTQLSDAVEKQRLGVEELEKAQATLVEAGSMVARAKRVLANACSEHQTRIRTRDEQLLALRQFETSRLARFVELCDRAPSTPAARPAPAARTPEKASVGGSELAKLSGA